jgi:hypothetical protein
MPTQSRGHATQRVLDRLGREQRGGADQHDPIVAAGERGYQTAPGAGIRHAVLAEA